MGERAQLARLRRRETRGEAAHRGGLLFGDPGVDQLPEPTLAQLVQDHIFRHAQVGRDDFVAHPWPRRRRHADVLLGDEHHRAWEILAGHQEAQGLEVLVERRQADLRANGHLDHIALGALLQDLIALHVPGGVLQDRVHLGLELLHLGHVDTDAHDPRHATGE